MIKGTISQVIGPAVEVKFEKDAAGDLISDLTLTYNQLRQGKITTELAEITAGRIALE